MPKRRSNGVSHATKVSHAPCRLIALEVSETVHLIASHHMVVVRLLLLLLSTATCWSLSTACQDTPPENRSSSSLAANKKGTAAAAFQFPQFPSQKPPVMKAWFCDGKTQKTLVDNLRQAQIVKSAAVQATMASVDRMYYLPEGYDKNPYADAPQPILKGQTCSAPHMHAHVLEDMLPYLLKRQEEILRSDDAAQQPLKVLDVGCGSGYLTACLGRWFKPLGKDQTFTVPGNVFGMDIHTELVNMTRQNMLKADGDLLDQGIVELRVGNGWTGWAEEAPFDAIHVGAAAASVPVDLAQQLLAPNGVLIVPVGAQNQVQKLLKIQRCKQSPKFSAQDYRVEELLQVRYVPLVQGPDKLRP